MSDAHYDALKASIHDATAAVIALLKKDTGGATESADATKVAGLDETQLKATADAGLAAHLAAVNPHGITPSMLGSYTTEEILALNTSGVPSSIIPASFYGLPDQESVLFSIDGLNVTLPIVKAFMQGTSRTIPKTTISLAQYDNTKTVRLYLRYRLGVLRYEVTTEYRPETHTNMLIGWFTTEGGMVTHGYVEVVFRIDVYRISVTPRGSAIIATIDGEVDGTGYLDKGWFENNASSTLNKGIKDD